MEKALEGKVLNIHTDNIQILFEPKSKDNQKEEKSKDEALSTKDNIYGKSKIIAILLALFLGRYGVHKFYLRKPALGFLYLIFSRFQFVFYLSICDAFIYLFMSKESWLEEFGYNKIPKKKKKE